MNAIHKTDYESGAGAKLLKERGVVVREIEGRSSLPTAESPHAILEELCYWTQEIDKKMARCRVEPNANHVRHFLSLVEQAHGELKKAESRSGDQQTHVRRAKVLIFAMARLAGRLDKK